MHRLTIDRLLLAISLLSVLLERLIVIHLRCLLILRSLSIVDPIRHILLIVRHSLHGIFSMISHFSLNASLLKLSFLSMISVATIDHYQKDDSDHNAAYYIGNLQDSVCRVVIVSTAIVAAHLSFIDIIKKVNYQKQFKQSSKHLASVPYRFKRIRILRGSSHLNSS